jgi:VCBS repeat protein
MPTGAPRLLACMRRGFVRGALLAACLWLTVATADAQAQIIASARYTDPTERYAHGILGDAIEWGALELTLSNGSIRAFHLPEDHVFEDVAPRLADVDADGQAEVIVIETDVTAGAALALYDATGKITETPHIGTRNRWLAPLGASDLDGDGVIELAYIDRPHLARILRIWRFEQSKLTPVASLQGLTNHRIGEPDIAGGIRTCNGTPEIIVATASWSDIVAVKWDGDAFTWSHVGTDTSRAAFKRALDCAD